MAKISKYIQFPLSLLRELLIDKDQTIQDMYCFGINYFSKKVSVDFYKQLYYDFHQELRRLPRSQNLLDQNLFDFLNNNAPRDEYYCGFTDGEFNPNESMLSEFKNTIESNTSIAPLIEKYKQEALINSAANLLGFKTWDVENTINADGSLTDNILPMVKFDILKDYQDNPKTEIEIIQLMFYLGIKSILMKDKYKKVTWEYVVARSFGYSSHKKLVEDNFEKNEYYIKYSKRYHREKVRGLLGDNWRITFYSINMRGFYVCKEGFEKAMIKTAKKSSAKYKRYKKKKKIEEIEKEVVIELLQPEPPF